MTAYDEAWRPIPGFHGYEVSSMGRLRSLDRLDTLGRPVKGRILATFVHPTTGYATGMLYRDGRPVNVLLHALVAAAWIGPRPDGMQVAHGDGDKTNNTPENLRYATPSENEHDKRAHGTNYQVNKTACPRGHAYDDANTYRNARGQRRCRRCRADGMATRRRAAGVPVRALASERAA